jgi:hypothetical protein
VRRSPAVVALFNQLLESHDPRRASRRGTGRGRRYCTVGRCHTIRGLGRNGRALAGHDRARGRTYELPGVKLRRHAWGAERRRGGRRTTRGSGRSIVHRDQLAGVRRRHVRGRDARPCTGCHRHQSNAHSYEPEPLHTRTSSHGFKRWSRSTRPSRTGISV